ncbi:type II toxin-antitoxin system RelE/ParE family toxin [Polynucleobacter sp. UK-Mo-2m-Kol15]|uniref:type II toxin-antitoxin system RelE/ParE family toxin n=1 Tax=Polynucleobacter sp. UK-Mo-2m-Kol15 TaxID=2576916 RepID=UPI001C0D3453|nr:type II toxin-antitoxin system RelE/ParE family toxin [Polynucleobacter sp. UK-Mo-2m-Kol15]MBU3576177.1 type II toxin-antitoxin system RelE/ParE family toxin [Polynucleobacter sp. UK-Mo-2m-Kol15]
MFKVLETNNFLEWLGSLRDLPTRIRLARRLDRARLGNLGDVKVLTDGVHEMREKFGPGWRMYYVLRGKTIIVMLGGGDKSSQASDIKAAKKLAKLLED